MRAIIFLLRLPVNWYKLMRTLELLIIELLRANKTNWCFYD